MAGCKSCSNCSPQPNVSPTKKAEKLQKGERSANPRYPHVLVGNQAVYSEDGLQVIVTVLSDDCDEECDCFTLKTQRVLRNARKERVLGERFEVTQPAGENCWKLHALI